MRLTTQTEHIEDFIELYKEIYIDKRFQRREAWDGSDRRAFIKAVYNNLNPSPVILVNAIMSREKAIQNKNQEDIEYFQSIIDAGYRYISIDGNNRTVTTVGYGDKNNDEFVLYNDEDRRIFNKKKVVVQYYEGVTREQMNSLAIAVNSGRPWNDQESRNAMPTVIADYIREVSESVTCSTDKIKVKKSRMGDDEFLAQTLFYEEYKTGANQKGLYSLYNTKVDTRTHKKIITLWDKLLCNHCVTKNLGKSAAFNLYVLLSYLNKEGLSLDKSKYKELYENYYTQEQVRWSDSKTLYDTGKGEQLTWAKLNGSVHKNLTMKLEKILKDLDLSEYTIEKDKKRAFSMKQKVQIWVRDNGMVRVNGSINGLWFNDEDRNMYKEVSLIEVLDGTKWAVDHIDPHSKGGQTTVENGEIVSTEYNKWKSNKKETVKI
jgi:hypothetical protein